MITLTKQQLDVLFNSTKTWEAMAEDFTAQAGIPINAKMVQEMFKSQGFNLRTRSRKTGDSWFTVINDITEVPQPELVGMEEEA